MRSTRLSRMLSNGALLLSLSATHVGRAQQDQAASPPANAAVFKILDVGAEPHVALRYRPEVGQEDTFVMTMRMSLNMNVDGAAGAPVDVPGMQFTVHAKVTEVTSDGHFNIGLEFVKAEVVDGPEVDTDVRAGMQRLLAPIKGVSALLVASNRGEVLSSRYANLEQLDPGMADQIRSLNTTFEQICTPFPEEAIGTGARWTVDQDLVVTGIKMHSSVEYRLASVEGEEVVVEASVSQSGSPQEVAIPNMPGQVMHIEMAKSTGKGSSRVWLDRVAYVFADITGHTDIKMTIDAQGTKHTVDQSLDVQVKIEPVIVGGVPDEPEP